MICDILSQKQKYRLLFSQMVSFTAYQLQKTWDGKEMFIISHEVIDINDKGHIIRLTTTAKTKYADRFNRNVENYMRRIARTSSSLLVPGYLFDKCLDV